MNYEFPKEFVWGVATASYQIEGAVREDGRGESIWDRFSHTPGKVRNGDTGDIACDHYHRYKDDVVIMAELGISSYRFSIAWPRVFPEGSGRPNPRGLDFYKRLLDELAGRGITAAVTLYHWDLPQALQDKGGWPNRDTAKYYRDYACYVFTQLGDRVKLWITHNEPWCTAYLGHGSGEHAPGIQDMKGSMQAAHNVLFSHGLAVEAYRELGGKGDIGITLNLTPAYPVSEKSEDIEAAKRFDGFFNRWYLDPVLKGSYPEDMFALYSQLDMAPQTVEGDLEVISAPIGFLGINYYSRAIVGAGGSRETMGIKRYPPEGPVTKMGWEIFPEGLYDLLTRINRDYGDLPLYITENGAAFEDEVENGEIHDKERIDYLDRHFTQAARAVAYGVPLKGYYVWSLMDNFEWAYGYDRRFGLVYVDYETQERIWKDSAKWYRDFLRR